MVHALEVSRIARTMARALSLDEDLTEAIALGHDLGHPPFGHAGERALDTVMQKFGGFSHNRHSLRVVQRLEKDGRGLELSPEVCEGILRHTGDEPSQTREGRLVSCADRIAYLSHDMDDAVRGGLLSLTDVPEDLRRVLGDTPRERINTLVHDLVDASRGGTVCFSPEKKAAVDALRAFMFENVYFNAKAKSEEEKVPGSVGMLFGYFLARYDGVPQTLRRVAEEDGEGPERAVCDYIAGMTDRFFESKFMEAFIPQGWKRV
jgi:dGTPase